MADRISEIFNSFQDYLSKEEVLREVCPNDLLQIKLTEFRVEMPT